MNRHRINTLAALAAGLVVLVSTGARPVAQVAPGSSAIPANRPVVTAHEWGTFTTVADAQGEATEWLPLSGQADLPCFVHYYDNREIKVFTATNIGVPLNYRQARERLRGRVRMETPVVYFYASADTSVDVAVQFPQGLFSEWYPAAEVIQSAAYERVLPVWKTMNSSMRWKNVRVLPSAAEKFPVENRSSHYYAARQTDASPVQVGTELEKFLFYRGVGGFAVPLSATLAEEDTVIIRNLGQRPVPGVILFSREGDRISFRVYGRLDTEIALTTPAPTGSLDALKDYLHQTLVETGLYPREAQAMLDTWGDTWFEEGTRVFYVMPPATVDEILPLTITPKPAAIARAFVGRIEVITPAMEATVARAFFANDAMTLGRYGRLIGPIGDRLIGKSVSLSEKARITSVLNERLRAFVAAGGGC